MKNLNILLCGAADISIYNNKFGVVVKNFGAQNAHYFNASHVYSNYKSWIENSRESVELADIIVYVISSKYGEITWETEYITAILQSKLYILMCEKTVFESAQYVGGKIFKDVESLGSQVFNDDTIKLEKLFKLIGSLHAQNRTIVAFDHDDFDKVLLQQLSYLFYDGIKKISDEQKKSSIFKLIEKDDTSLFVDYVISDIEEKLLRNRLFDIAEKKSFRKTVLKLFVEKKLLETDDVVNLLMDKEQGIVRSTCDMISDMDFNKISLDQVFEQLIILLQRENRDIGIDNRAIPNMIKVDLKKAVEYLGNLKPFDKINAPTRILNGLNKDFENVLSNLNQNQFKDNFLYLIKSSYNFDPSDVELSKPYNEMKSKLKVNNILLD